MSHGVGRNKVGRIQTVVGVVVVMIMVMMMMMVTMVMVIVVMVMMMVMMMPSQYLTNDHIKCMLLMPMRMLTCAVVKSWWLYK